MVKKIVVYGLAALDLCIVCWYVAWRVHRPWSIRGSALDYAWASPSVAPVYQCHYKVHIAPDHTGTVTYWEGTGGEPPQVWPFHMTDAAYDELVKRLTSDDVLGTPGLEGDSLRPGDSWNELRVTQGSLSATARGGPADYFTAMQTAVPNEVFVRMPLAHR